MKRFFLVFAGLLVGFTAGSWTPLGDLGSFGNVKSLVLKSDKVSSLFGRFASQSAEDLGENSKITTSLSPEARAKFEPWLDVIEDLHRSSLTLDRHNQIIRQLTEAVSGPTSAPLSLAAAGNQSGQNAIFADSPNQELMQVIGAVEAENQEISFYLQSRSPSDVEYHLTRAIYESNNQWLETLRFMVQKNNGNATSASAGTLTPRIEALRQKVEESTFLGRKRVMEDIERLAALDIGTPEQSAFRNNLIAFIESYNASFDVEETMASLVVEYPGLIAQTLSGHNVVREIATWDMQTLQLVSERGQISDYRKELSASLSAPMS